MKKAKKRLYRHPVCIYAVLQFTYISAKNKELIQTVMWFSGAIKTTYTPESNQYDWTQTVQWIRVRDELIIMWCMHTHIDTLLAPSYV